MNEALWWLVGIALALLLVPVLLETLRRRDFRRQASGKRPEREAPRDIPVSYDPPAKASPARESEKELARMKSRQNSLGPK
jgi:hypothetical protein